MGQHDVEERERRRRADADAGPPRAAPVPGRTQSLFANVELGARPNHQYGLAGPVIGRGRQFADMDALLQRYNAPTRDALYGPGNDPTAARGTVSRPGARDYPAVDWGGNVTLEHGDGFARNTTIAGEHPLEGSITRNLVVDLARDGGYRVLTLGRGEAGAQLPTAVGAAAGGALGGAAGSPLGPMGRRYGARAGAALGGATAQNGSHLVNPELGRIAFSQLDDSMAAAEAGTPNPNRTRPNGPLVEARSLLDATFAGAGAALGIGGARPEGTPQQQIVYDLARDLNARGSVEGYFMQSAVLPGVYHVTPRGTTYYERGEDGRVVERPVDPNAGL